MGNEKEGSYFCFAELQMSSERDPRGVMNSFKKAKVYGEKPTRENRTKVTIGMYLVNPKSCTNRGKKF